MGNLSQGRRVSEMCKGLLHEQAVSRVLLYEQDVLY